MGDGPPDRVGVEHAGDGVDLGGLQRLFEAQRREDRRQPLGEHGFAGAGRADHEDVVATGGGDFERALGGMLAADVLEVVREVLQFIEHVGGFDAEWLGVEPPMAAELSSSRTSSSESDGIDIHAFDDGGFAGIGCGNDEVFNACARAATAMGSMPCTARRVPSRPSSPTSRKSETP